jgi:carboxypeptidase Taq
VTGSAPPEYGQLLERMAQLADLRSIGGLLSWDRSTMMPRTGADARGHQAATLESVAHGRQTHPEVGRLLDRLEPWAAQLDPDSDAARTVGIVRRDFDRAVRVPDSLAADMAWAESAGEQAWLAARAAGGDFGRFRDALARHLELRRAYIACFDDYEHPYDVLLEDYEQDLRVADVRPLLAELQAALVPLVAAATERADGAADVLRGTFPHDRQRAAMLDVLRAVGFDDESWRLDASPHPFASAQSTRDVRVTTIFDERDLGVTLYSVLHEFGHGLYESQVDPAYARTPLADLASLGLHESQSRLWENVIGHSRPFCAWILPLLQSSFPESFAGVDAAGFHRAINRVAPSAVRIFADETTYNLHIVLRTELEMRLVEGTLEVDELPAAWNEGMHRLLGVEVTDDFHGVLQDIHWAVGSFGYFPTYTVGNLMAAQFWQCLRADLPDVDEQIAGGEFAALREWLRENVHRHGRKFSPRELLHRVTGEPLRVAAFIAYLGDKLVDLGAIEAGAAPQASTAT